MRIETVGFDELEAALEEIPKALQRELVLKALRKAAEPVLQEARSRCRRRSRRTYAVNVKDREGKVRQEHFVIGNLAESLRVEAVPASRGPGVFVKIGPDRDHYYGLFVEKGTKAYPKRRSTKPKPGEKRPYHLRGRAALRAHAATRAFPFLAPAIEYTSREALKILGEELKNAIEAKAEALFKQAKAGKLSGKSREALLGELVR